MSARGARRRASRQSRRRGRPSGSQSTSMAVQQGMQPGNRIRLFLFPPEAPLARFLASTLAAVTWYVFNTGLVQRKCGVSCSGPCAVREGFDRDRRAEYLEVECEGCEYLDALAARLWGMRARSFTAAAWDDVRLEFEENSQRYVFNAGTFISRRWPYVKAALERVLEKYLKYFYARGFSVEPLQGERVVRGTPQPQSGFIDLLLSNMSAYIHGLEQVRRMTSERFTSGIPRTVNVLLADLGDMGVGLQEAVETLYDVNVSKDCSCRLSPKVGAARVARRLADYGGDFVGWLHRLLIVEILYLLTRGSVELLARWPSIAVVHYGRQDDPNDTRFIEYAVVGGEDLLLAYHSISGAAGELGVGTWRLLGFLEALPRCILDAAGRGLLRDNEVSGLVSRLTPLYDSVLQGFVDRDVLYQIVRLLYSKDVSSVSSCSFAASMLRG